MRVLENWPSAVRATLAINGAPPGPRATLCRCGQPRHQFQRFLDIGRTAMGSGVALWHGGYWVVEGWVDLWRGRRRQGRVDDR